MATSVLLNIIILWGTFAGQQENQLALALTRNLAKPPNKQRSHSIMFNRALNGLEKDKFQRLIDKIEADAVQFAKKIEELAINRCQSYELEKCSRRNYNDCSSQLPNPTCMDGEDYHIPACGREPCGALFDFSTSVVGIRSDRALDDNGTPESNQDVETMCYSLAMDEWLQTKRAQDAEYWEGMGFEPEGWYFGSRTGLFRIWPGRSYARCGRLDPTRRPWFVAAGSGPKNVIMVLDTSESMFGVRLDLLKEAAKRIVETLAIGDRIAIVPFSSEASSISNYGKMYIANKVSKQVLLDAIDGLEAGGQTNYYDAFAAAFDILDESIAEVAVRCNTAILFFTDGLMNLPEDKTEEDVVDLIERRIREANRNLPKPILLFTYSVEEEEENSLPRKLACSTEWGVWSKVEQKDIANSLSSYYLLFALGVRADQDESFVAWVEPYIFFSSGELGTTASVPIYDRSVTPHIFLGVAGIDLRLAPLTATLGVEDDSDSTLTVERVARLATEVCPALDLLPCELESFRRHGAAGDAALCLKNCSTSEYVVVEAEECPGISRYPEKLYQNTDLVGLTYEAKVCCVLGKEEASALDLCPASEAPSMSPTPSPKPAVPGNGSSSSSVSSTTFTTLVVIAAVVGVVLVAILFFEKPRRFLRECCSPVGANKKQGSAEVEHAIPENVATSALDLDETSQGKKHTQHSLYDIFIIHTGASRRFVARPMKRCLEQNEQDDSSVRPPLRCFLDNDMPSRSGDPKEQMASALETCRYAVAIVSRAFLEKRHPCEELKYAFRRNEWLKQQHLWTSLYIVLYDLTLDDYEKYYRKHPDKLPNIKSHVVIRHELFGNPSEMYERVRTEIVASDDSGALAQWNGFLGRRLLRGDFDGFPKATRIYNDVNSDPDDSSAAVSTSHAD